MVRINKVIIKAMMMKCLKKIVEKSSVIIYDYKQIKEEGGASC